MRRGEADRSAILFGLFVSTAFTHVTFPEARAGGRLRSVRKARSARSLCLGCALSADEGGSLRLRVNEAEG